MSGKPIYYWDSPVFIAWITDEDRPPGDMEGITAVVKDIDSEKCRLLTSALTRLEVLEAGVGQGANEGFEDFLDRPDITVASVELSVIDVAYNIRNYYRASSDYKKTVSVPDAIHLATAIVNGASVFQTFDSENRKNSLGLIPLSGTVGGRYELRIERPMSKQPDFFAGRSE